jgi:hypothetical protein
MREQHEWQLLQYQKEETKAIEMHTAARKNIRKLMLASAAESGMEVGTVVSNSKRGGKMSITHFTIEQLDGVGKYGWFVAAHGVPMAKTGKPMKRRDPQLIGPVEVLKVDK